MSSVSLNSQEMLQILESSDTSSEVKLQHIQALKTHIKKDSIDLDEVPMYLHIIMKGLEVKESGISNVSFNALSYLIKRVSVQDQSGNILKQQSFLILPVLINKLGSNNVVVAKKALEDYWLSSPEEVENAINEISFTSFNLRLAIEAVQWMEQIVKNVSSKFNVRFFVPAILKCVSDNQDNQDLIDSVSALFNSYAQNSPIQNIGQYLENQCKSLNINKKLAKSILPGSRPSSSESVSTRSSEKREDKSKSSANLAEEDIKYFSSSLSTLLNKVNYDLVVSIQPKDISHGSELNRLLEPYYDCFEGKETEFNWKKREKCIVEVRMILRGNAATSFREDLISGLKEFANPICKGANSLRTTLCTHSCQLIKECAIILSSEFEPCADLLFPTLMKLCLSTKSITSTNANMAMSALYANLHCNSKLFHRILQSMDEPNFKPRSFAALWLQILLLRYALDHSFLNGHCGQAIDTANKLLVKLLKDANPNVRQVSKDCYWCFSKIFPEESEALMTRFDTNTIRALERSQRELGPSATTSRKLSTKASAPPMRESMWDRMKESKQNREGSRSASRESSNVPPVAVLNRAGKTARPEKQALKNESNRPAPRASSWNAPPKDQAPFVEKARSKTEVLKKSPIHKEDEVLIRHSSSEPPTGTSRVFSRDQDPMIEFMSSRNTSDLIEGVNLLKYAIISKEDVSNAHALKSRLSYISEKDPIVLKQLFASNEYVFKTAAKLFQLDDFVRVCSIIFTEIDQRIYELATSDTDFNDFFIAEIQLLTTVIDSPNIPGSTAFKYLISTYQFKIAKSIFQTFSIALTKTTFTDVQFGELFQELVRSIVVLKSSEAYSDLKQLFCQLYAIDSNKFIQLLDEAEFAMKDEIELIVGIDSTVLLENPLDHSVFEMTEVNPGGINDFALQPADDGFTMVVPKLRNNMVDDKNNDTIKSAALGQIEEAGEDDAMMVDAENGSHNIVQRKSSTPVASETNPEDKGDDDKLILEGTRPFKLGRSAHSETASVLEQNKCNKPQDDLVEDMASIHIQNPSTQSTKALESFQSMIERTDPLNSRAKKVKKIDIFEDSKPAADGVRDEKNMGSLTYYSNFFRKGLPGDFLSIVQFDKHCEIIASMVNLEEKTQSILVVSDSIDSLNAMSFEFREYFLATGKHTLSKSLWSYFELGFQYAARQMTQQEVMDGLFLLKLLSRYDESMDAEEIWKVIGYTCKLVTRIDEEVYLIWTEIIESLIKYGSNNSDDVSSLKTRFEAIVLEYLEKTSNSKLNFSIVQLCFNFLSTTLIQDGDLDEDKICRLDKILGKFLVNEEPIFRRSAIVCYSRLARNESMSPEQKLFMARLKARYPISQQRLIESYTN